MIAGVADRAQNGKLKAYIRKENLRLRTAEKTEKFSIKNVDFLENWRIITSCMDTIDFSRIPKCGSCPDLTDFKVVVGAKQLKKALQRGTARYVYLAENADPAITELLGALCRQNDIPISWVATMADLGHACGIDVGAAAAAVID